MKRKKILIGVLIPVGIILVAAAGLRFWYQAGHSSSEPVNVYPFQYLGMTEYWGDSQESYGPVTTDRIQTIYLSDTQTVTEILVSQGDTVKKGDLLMTFDTTLSDLALERERLEVEKLKLQLEDAEKQLAQINSMKPMVIPSFTEKEETDENLGTALNDPYQISSQSAYDGSTKEKALICWIGSETAIDDSVFEAIRQQAEQFQRINAPEEEETESTEDPDEEPTEESPEFPTETPTQPEEELTVNQFYVIFKVTQKDMSLGQTMTWQGMLVTRNESANTYSFKLFDASEVPDHMRVQAGGDAQEVPEIDYGSGFTSAQIAQMRSEQEKTIKDLQFQIKMAEADYKIKQTEFSDGNIYAEFDGEVVLVLTEEEAKLTMQPIIKVSGGGGFYVRGSVNELEKDNLQIGQEVTINDWNTGMTYTGFIQSVGDFPSSDGYWSGIGNPNTSYYPFIVFVDGSADLQEGRYVSIIYSSSTAQNGIYLQNPFIRTENGQSYVYVMGQDGKLEQRFVSTGKSLWGSYTEILDGLSTEDLIAFPYGKNVKAGAAAVECNDMSELYG